MRNEILILKAQIAEDKEKLKVLLYKADNALIAIRQTLNPYHGGDLTIIDSEKALITTIEFHNLVTEARYLKDKIQRMERDLG